MIPPIKRGTARRLGIRPPIDPALYFMQARINLMAWQMDVIAQMYGQPPWRLRWAGPLPEPTEPEIYIPGRDPGPARFVR